jgi:hypothetical protein
LRAKAFRLAEENFVSLLQEEVGRANANADSASEAGQGISSERCIRQAKKLSNAKTDRK